MYISSSNQGLIRRLAPLSGPGSLQTSRQGILPRVNAHVQEPLYASTKLFTPMYPCDESNLDSMVCLAPEAQADSSGLGGPKSAIMPGYGLQYKSGLLEEPNGYEVTK